MSAEADLCPRLKCSHFDRCFLFRARRRAAEADVVVVNHHLLAADLSVRQAQDNWEEAAVLPPYKRLDPRRGPPPRRRRGRPPRHPGDAAARSVGCWRGSSGTAAGWLPTLAHELIGRGDLLSRASLDLLHQRLLPALGDARRASDAMFLRLLPAARRRGRGPASPGRRLRFGRDLGRGPGLRAGCHARGVSLAPGIGRDDRRPAGRIGGIRAARHHPAGAACRHAPARCNLRRPQPIAPPGGRRHAHRALDGADAARSERQPLGRAARSGAGTPGAALRPARHGRAHERHARRRR